MILGLYHNKPLRLIASATSFRAFKLGSVVKWDVFICTDQRPYRLNENSFETDPTIWELGFGEIVERGGNRVLIKEEIENRVEGKAEYACMRAPRFRKRTSTEKHVLAQQKSRGREFRRRFRLAKKIEQKTTEVSSMKDRMVAAAVGEGSTQRRRSTVVGIVGNLTRSTLDLKVSTSTVVSRIWYGGSHSDSG
ncbi:hypothetical protein LXL04_039193 [Taraxacum kok-saghyz]